ncbi:MAG: hypothetical protein ACLVAW_18655 [Eisenbergiella massiliensis]
MDNLKLLHQWYMDGIVNPDANVLRIPKKLLSPPHGLAERGSYLADAERR